MDDPGDRRSGLRRGSRDRRRASWSEFRAAYPGIIAALGIAFLFMLGIDAWLFYNRWRYESETRRLRAGMTDVERRKADLAMANDENRLRVMVELIRRQAQGDRDLHLSVAVDSGVMYLEREGATLREMPVEVGPERTIGAPPDTVRIVAPRGARTIERVFTSDSGWEVPEWVYTDRGIPVARDRMIRGALGPGAIILNGGTVIYSMPSVGPLNDSTYVMPGAIRASAADLKAILPNLAPGMTIYLY